MALVLGPNGLESEVPDDVAKSLVGNGERGYSYAPEPPAPAPRKRAPSKRIRAIN
jgi:hypothetical protein